MNCNVFQGLRTVVEKETTDIVHVHGDTKTKMSAEKIILDTDGVLRN